MDTWTENITGIAPRPLTTQTGNGRFRFAVDQKVTLPFLIADIKNTAREMHDLDPQPFYLIVTDLDRRVFAVEGPMTDSRPWDDAAIFARSHHRHIVCGPVGAERDELAAEHRNAHHLAGVPPGSIIRPRS
jgi:hypothetical protein